MTLQTRKRKNEFEKNWRKVRRDLEQSRITLEIPIAFSAAWRLLVFNQKNLDPQLLGEFEDFIRKLAYESWGEGTLTIFNRRVAKVTFAHADGRKISYPIENKLTDEVKGALK